jgi:hypothetical protein
MPAATGPSVRAALDRTGRLIPAALLPEGQPVSVPVAPLLPQFAVSNHPRRPAALYVITSVDDRGRIGDTSTLRALDWQPGATVGFQVVPEVEVVAVHPGPGMPITAEGRLRLPLAVRRRLHLQPRDRVLLAAEPQHGRLVVATMAALDTLIARAWAAS